MKVKNIFKTLAFAMLMPAMLLTTACIDNELPREASHEIPVTLKVTRQINPDTRATYNESTKKLSFSAGDKLFVGGYYDGWSKGFAGTLDYDAESGKFKGTIYTEDDTYSTYEALFGNSDYTIATLLPAGYEDHGYLVINTQGTEEKYDDYVEDSNEYTLATSKAAGVAQFSYEKSYYYDDGFALNPDNAILNFTITGLAASTSVNVSLKSQAYKITGTVTTDASGTATFAAGIMYGLNLQPFSLTVGGNPITLVSSDKVVEEGKIYNITRSAAPAAKAAAEATAEDKGKLIGTDGKIYADAAAATAAGTTAVAKIVYVGSDNGESAPYNHGLALALSDANGGSYCEWSTSSTKVHTYNPTSSSFESESGLQYNATHNSDTYPAFKAAIANNGTASPTGCSAWFLPSGYQWQKMAGAVGGYNKLGLMIYRVYWSSTEYSANNAWYFDSPDGNWYNDSKGYGNRVRACLAF